MPLSLTVKTYEVDDLFLGDYVQEQGGDGIYRVNFDDPDVPPGPGNAWMVIAPSVKRYPADIPFSKNDYVQLNEGSAARFFQANADTNLEPNEALLIWEDVSSDKVHEFSISQQFAEGQFVWLEEGALISFFRSNAATINVHPRNEINTNIWDVLDCEDLGRPTPKFDFTVSYEAKQRIKYDDPGFTLPPPDPGCTLYLAKKRVTRLGPSLESLEWTLESAIDAYDPLRVYCEGEFVRFRTTSEDGGTNAGLFRARATFVGVAPDSGARFWEPFDKETVSAFGQQTKYPLGSYVKTGEGEDEKFFRARAGIDGQKYAPGGGQHVWEEKAAIKTYDAISIFERGDFVLFVDGLIYRALVDLQGDDPISEPTFWRLAGEIQTYVPERSYLADAHVALEVDGIKNVFRAIQNLEANAEPGPETAPNDNWVLVPTSYPYKYFRHLALQRLTISVDVKNVQDLILENDQGILDSSKPFEPFGSAPKKGSNLYIGSHEIFQKRLAGSVNPPNLRLRVEWGDLPEVEFSSYYQNYVDQNNTGITVADNHIFTVSVDALEHGEWKTKGPSSRPLFQNQTGLPEADLTLEINTEIFTVRQANLKPFENFSIGLDRGFIRLHLLQDFFHGDFAKSLATQAIKESLEGKCRCSVAE